MEDLNLFSRERAGQPEKHRVTTVYIPQISPGSHLSASLHILEPSLVFVPERVTHSGEEARNNIRGAEMWSAGWVFRALNDTVAFLIRGEGYFCLPVMFLAGVRVHEIPCGLLREVVEAPGETYPWSTKYRYDFISEYRSLSSLRYAAADVAFRNTQHTHFRAIV